MLLLRLFLLGSLAIRAVSQPGTSGNCDVCGKTWCYLTQGNTCAAAFCSSSSYCGGVNGATVLSAACFLQPCPNYIAPPPPSPTSSPASRTPTPTPNYNGIESPTTCSACIAGGWRWCHPGPPSGPKGSCDPWGAFCSSKSTCHGQSAYSTTTNCNDACPASASPQPVVAPKAGAAADAEAAGGGGGIAAIVICLVLIPAGLFALIWAQRHQPQHLPEFLKPGSAAAGYTMAFGTKMEEAAGAAYTGAQGLMNPSRAPLKGAASGPPVITTSPLSLAAVGAEQAPAAGQAADAGLWTRKQSPEGDTWFVAPSGEVSWTLPAGARLADAPQYAASSAPQN